MKRNKMKKFIIKYMALLIISTAVLLSCHSSVSTSSYPPPPTDFQDVKDFITGAQARYTEGLTCGGNSYAPEIGLSSSDFLAITVNDSTIILGGKTYTYKTTSISAELKYPDVSIGDYLITYRDATPGVTSTGGGHSILVKAFKAGKPVGEFTFHEIDYIIINDSVYLQKFTIGDLVFLFMYYKPDCNSNVRLWLILMPA